VQPAINFLAEPSSKGDSAKSARPLTSPSVEHQPVFRTLTTIALIVFGLFVVVRFYEQDWDATKNQQSQLVGTVAYVIDGDSAVLSDQTGSEMTIRLEGIDAPEIDQPFGNESKRWLSDATANTSVRAIASGTDRYGRTLANLYVGDRWLNHELVASGLAWHYAKYKPDAELVQRNADFGKTQSQLHHGTTAASNGSMRRYRPTSRERDETNL
jgi:micrococcal nuclease